MVARIYKPARTAMQSGKALTKDWVLEHEATSAREIDSLMGWTSSRDTQSQVRLKFETREDAVAYAERNGLPYFVDEPAEKTVSTKSYADNFRFGRIGSWTH